jgi:hypothetical protein
VAFEAEAWAVREADSKYRKH